MTEYFIILINSLYGGENMNILEGKPSFRFKNIINQLSVGIDTFDLNRCDERTFYITIIVGHANHSTCCDLIFLIDRDELFGAISLNNLYDNIQQFFSRHFNYHLLYTDEMQLAHIATKNHKFLESIRLYTQKYPKNQMKLSI